MPLTTQDRMYIEQRLANDAKSPMIAYLLWFFLGCLGGHRLYLGRGKSGLLMALLFLVGIVSSMAVVGLAILAFVGIWWVVDAFVIPSIIDGQKRQARRHLEDEVSGGGEALATVDTSKWSKRDQQEHQRQLRLSGMDSKS